MKKILIVFFILLFFLTITSCKKKDTKPDDNIPIKPITEYITLTINYDKDVYTKKIVKGSVLDLEPYDDGNYAFFGYYDEDGNKRDGTIINEDTVLTADVVRYGTEYKITYNLNGGTLPVGAKPKYYYIYNEEYELPTPRGEANFEFLGWLYNEEYIEIIPAGMRGDIILDAVWQDNNIYHNITYHADSGNFEGDLTFKEGINYHLPTPTKDGYYFRGWYLEESFETKIIDTLDYTTDLELYAKWVKKNKENTYVSILGDSISTFEGTIPDGYATYYPQGDVVSANDLWWNILIKNLGVNLLINNSYSGSFVSRGTAYGASISRLNNLAEGNNTPDVVIIYLGTNDFSHSVNTATFTSMYKQMLDNIRYLYDDVEIYILNFPYNTYGDSAKKYRLEYNTALIGIAEEYNVNLISISDIFDIYNSGTMIYAGAHPSKAGQAKIAETVYNKMKDFLN